LEFISNSSAGFGSEDRFLLEKNILILFENSKITPETAVKATANT